MDRWIDGWMDGWMEGGEEGRKGGRQEGRKAGRKEGRRKMFFALRMKQEQCRTAKTTKRKKVTQVQRALWTFTINSGHMFSTVNVVYL